MRPLVPFWILLSLGSAHAQTGSPNPLPPTPMQTITRLVLSASQQVVVFAPVMRQFELADALRRVMVERKVKVYLLTLLGSVNDSGSFFAPLTLAGAVSMSANIQGGLDAQPFLVVDNQAVMQGRLITLPEPPGITYKVSLSRDPVLIAKLMDWYVKTSKVATHVNKSDVILRYYVK